MNIPISDAVHRPDLAQPAHFEQLFKTHFEALYRYAYRIVEDADAAEEIVQATFAALWEKRHSLKIEESGQAYLYRAVHNRSLNHLQHGKVRKAHRAYVAWQGEAAAQPSEGGSFRELEHRLEVALRALPEACRTVFQLSRFEELKYREIADRLNISVKTVEAQMGKALRILRVQLADLLPILLSLLSTFFNSQP